MCLNVVSADTPSVVQLGYSPDFNDPHCYKDWNSRKSFFPDSAVGTGRAGAATNQLVNNDQFGRCIDVTADDVDSDFLVVFPCKQRPSGDVQWNQFWITPTIPAGATSASGPVYTTWKGVRYCMTSPGSAAPGKWVRVHPCPAVIPPEMTWTYREDTGFYSTSFRIESTYGAAGVNFCMSPTDPNAASPDLWVTFDVPFSKLVLASCTGSDLQKWNVSPFTVTGPLKDVVER
jgi:hypothetical protein